MRTLAHCGLAAGFAILTGCAHMGHTPPSPPRAHPLPVNCRAGDCTVKITVDACHKDKIYADREPLVVDRQYKGHIDWDLVTPGYSFAPNGIEIFQEDDDEFDGKDHKPKKFKWRNKHNQNHTYKYSINVVPDAQPRIVCTKDPSIMN